MKIIFWDWDGVLVSNLYLKKYYNLTLDNNISKNKHLIKNINNKLQSVFISFNWELVLKFHKLGYKQIIVSNGKEEEIVKQLKNAVFNEFEMILTAQKFKPKPDKEMFEFAKNKYNFNYQDAFFFGDSETDELIGRKLGLKFDYLNDDYLNTIKLARKIQII